MKKTTSYFLLGLTVLAVSAIIFYCRGNTPATAAPQPITATELKLNTVVTITIYDSQDNSLLSECMKLCDKYESIFSRTKTDSELYQLNHRTLQPVSGSADTYPISRELADLLSLGLSYSKASGNAFHIAIAPLTALWDFQSQNPSVPKEEDIQSAVSQCTYEGVVIKDREITLPSPDTQFELGAIAKGYIADRLKDYLLSRNVNSAIINLGGNVLCIGNKPDGAPFRIGIQKPFAQRSETVAIMEITGKSVVSSGIYERYFEENGKQYHHILDPATGYPYDNDLVSVTIISDKSVDGDALSTTCFSLGYEKGLEYVQSLKNIQAVFITKDYQVHYTEGFEKAITVHEASDEPNF